MPAAWSAVTVRQLLNHTSGVPDYTKSAAFAKQFKTDPRGFVSPQKVIDWVRADPLQFAPGSRFEYSNTDNIVIGLIVEAIAREPYGKALKEIVFDPAKLRRTTFPTKVALPSPFIHGYLTAPGEKPEDVSTILSPSGAWASGAIVSTPRDLNAFIRADLGLKFFSRAQQREQMRFVAGRRIEPARAGQELRRPGALPLPDQVRHGLRPHRQLPRLRPVGRRQRRRQARGDDLTEHPGSEWQAPRPAARPAGDRRLRPAG